MFQILNEFFRVWLGEFSQYGGGADKKVQRRPINTRDIIKNLFSWQMFNPWNGIGCDFDMDFTVIKFWMQFTKKEMEW